MTKATRAGRERIIAVHLDLKGVMFRPGYIPQLLADLASQGVNAVLVEYEDVFPFEGIDVAWDPSVCWSKRTLSDFLAEAERQGIEVIPLQQCLGHLEYVYRWRRYRRFAEDAKYPSTLCLSNRVAKSVALEMLRQVLYAHPDSRYIHLGMDEAHALLNSKLVQERGDVLAVFLDYLRELCDFIEPFGKTPIIWTDMLEDHFRPDAFEEFRDRVIFAPWDYSSSGRTMKTGRIRGMRVRKKWLEDPGDPAAPAVGPGTKFIEDLPPDVMQAVQPYLKPDGFRTLFQVDLWTKLGFRVLGATVVRSSSHLAVMADYNKLAGNIGAWGEAIRRTNQMGLIGTSWARGTTFCPPGFNVDLTWPLVAELSNVLGGRPEPFWPDVPACAQERIFAQLGRCRQDWSVEADLADEMSAVASGIETHAYEWRSIELMARVLDLHRRAEFAQLEVDFFHANSRPVAAEWQRRINDEGHVLKDLRALRAEVRAHFGERCHGDAFREWVRDLFDLWERRLKECRAVCRAKKARARDVYGG